MTPLSHKFIGITSICDWYFSGSGSCWQSFEWKCWCAAIIWL